MCDDNNTSTLDGGHRGGGHDHGLTRRGAIGAGAAGGVALLFAGIKGTSSGALLDALGPEVTEAAAGTCTMTPAKTVGPYFVEEKLNRSDVRTNTTDGAVQAHEHHARVHLAAVLRRRAERRRVQRPQPVQGPRAHDAGHHGRDRRHLRRRRRVAVADAGRGRRRLRGGLLGRRQPDDLADRQLQRRRPGRRRPRRADVHRHHDGHGRQERRGGPEGQAMVRTVLGTRQLKLTLKASEPVMVRARLTRGNRTVASRKATLQAGTRTVKVTIPDDAKAGAARLRLTLTDAAGNTKAYRRTVHIRT